MSLTLFFLLKIIVKSFPALNVDKLLRVVASRADSVRGDIRGFLALNAATFVAINIKQKINPKTKQ